eukprot:CAMPEP_0169129038 /NCGR_PEP_ID=MMETSP1015-20121227/36906_1 /TAXON_ID=342587 /ORGANISM="Karlodinium micrum, Strain CCMP2283" /LENGTH=396 /DNA_ID=CAMNT_0009193017 /DNA_START=63 /DNA_END=1253 /DNA_ORIENTATION=+
MDVYASMFIRPPRHAYSVADLGPTRFRLHGRTYVRKDVELINRRGQKLACSHFVDAKSYDSKRPCVVYLHGNSSSRCECYPVLPYLLQQDLTVFCFDFAGSGISTGDYISLGWYEKDDLQTVLEHLMGKSSVASIGVYGRSMGAATAIFGASEDNSISACVLDSAFSDIATVATEVIRRKCRVPKVLVSAALQVVRRDVKTKADFDLLDLVPANVAPRAMCPALFGAASDDTFILPSHTQRVYDAWAGEKLFYQYSGGHNGARPGWFLEEAAFFLSHALCKRANIVCPIIERRYEERVPAPVASDARLSKAVSICKCDKHNSAKMRKMSGCCYKPVADVPVLVQLPAPAAQNANACRKPKSRVRRTRSALEDADAEHAYFTGRALDDADAATMCSL